MIFGCTLSCLKTSGSDYVTQRWVEGKQEIDKKRNLVFFTWGLLYLGGVQYFLYCKVFAQRLFPSAAAFAAKPLAEKVADRAGQVTVVKQVVLDQFVHHPFFFFPLFYQVKEFIEGGRPADGLRNCMRNWKEDCITLWTIWVPVQIFNMSFCPLWLRIPCISVVSAGYTCVISYMRGGREKQLETEPAESASPLAAPEWLQGGLAGLKVAA